MKNRRILSFVVAAIVLVSTFAVMGLTNVFAATPISSAEQFVQIFSGKKAVEGDYTLTTNIALPAGYVPSSFSGTLDGGGNTISGMTTPLFTSLAGEVKALTLEGEINDTVSSAAIGALAQSAGAKLTVLNLTNKVKVTTTAAAATGGFIGEVRGTNAVSFKNCTNEGAITGSDATRGVGGFVGTAVGTGNTAHASVTVDRSVNHGAITNPSGTGVFGAAGFVGSGERYTVEISYSVNNGDVASAANGLGGFFGSALEWDKNSDAYRDVFTACYCVNNGDITATGLEQHGPAGIAGRLARAKNMKYTFEYCYNTGKITNAETGGSAGGILGYTNNGTGSVITFNGCYNVGVMEGGLYRHMIGMTGALVSSTGIKNCYLETKGSSINNNPYEQIVACDSFTDKAAFNEAVCALGEYFVDENTNGGYPIFKWQCEHKKTFTTLIGEYCDACGEKLRDVEDTSVAFDGGTIEETGTDAYTVGTKSISSFVSYRSGQMGGTRDVRFVLALDLEAAKSYDYINFDITFYREGRIVKSLQLDLDELIFYRTASGAGHTYTAAEGDVLFGVVVKAVPNQTWDTAVLSAAVSDDTVLASKAENPTFASQNNAEGMEEIGVMTFNLRYDISSHPLMALNVRGPHLMEIIDKYDPDSVGFNEATNNWMKWLRSSMAVKGYAYVGVGRDNAADNTSATGNGNEFSPIFYKADKYNVLKSDTIWLSKTPEERSKGWGSSYNRICTYAVLKNKETGEIYAHFSTHLDHQQMTAQENSVYVIETYIRAILEEYGDIGVVLTGDFNAVEFQPNNPDYDAFTYNGVTSYMDDTRYLATELGVVGKSFMGYNPEQWEQGYETDKDKPNIDTSAAPIDYIFVKKGAYTCSYYTIVNDTFTFDHEGKTWHNHPISDHYGVYARVTCVKPDAPFIKDESKLVDLKATVSTTKPSGLLAELTGGLSIQSTFDAANTEYAIANLLKKDNSFAMVSVAGAKHGYWEITLEPAADLDLKFSGLSFTTASSDHPYNLRVFVSAEGRTWEQVGTSYAEKLAGNTTYYVKTEDVIRTHYVKLVFTDTPNSARLNNITLFAEAVGNGRVVPSRVTVTAGPSFNSTEGAEKMFDGKTSTKFYCRQYSQGAVPANPAPMGAILFKTDTPVTVTHFNMVNGNDTSSYSGRLPRQWTLYGSTDGENYVVIDNETKPNLSNVNYAVHRYTVDTPGSYQYYKLVFMCGNDGNVQFSEMELFETIS